MYTVLRVCIYDFFLIITPYMKYIYIGIQYNMLPAAMMYSRSYYKIQIHVLYRQLKKYTYILFAEHRTLCRS